MWVILVFLFIYLSVVILLTHCVVDILSFTLTSVLLKCIDFYFLCMLSVVSFLVLFCVAWLIAYCWHKPLCAFLTSYRLLLGKIFFPSHWSFGCNPTGDICCHFWWLMRHSDTQFPCWLTSAYLCWSLRHKFNSVTELFRSPLSG